MEVLKQSIKHSNRVAAIFNGQSYTYSDLLQYSSQLASQLQQYQQQNIALLTPQSHDYIIGQFAIWGSGSASVPLCKSHPVAEWQYILENSNSKCILVHPSFTNKIKKLAENLKLNLIEFSSNTLEKSSLNHNFIEQDERNPALMIYTSGTTGRPKGAVLSNKAISSQIKSLSQAWQWNSNDHILETLPLHHVHGVINVVNCALFNGAKITFHDGFQASNVWEEFQKGDLTVFMAVPTIYHKLMEFYESQNINANFENFRLMVSGSMALPSPMFYRWQEITGQQLLERYGMTECGMILSNDYQGVKRPGFVGRPLPGVNVKTVDGELWVKGDNLFTEYYNNQKATQEAFSENGWFMTGDTVSDEDGFFKIEGRTSVDIIKSAGYKISALDIEQIALEYQNIKEIAIVGIPDQQYGQIIGAIIKVNSQFTKEDFTEWCKAKMANYKVPRKIWIVDEIPRNQMGKVNKKELVKLFL